MAPIIVTGDQIFEVRLDIINVSKGQGTLVTLENMIPLEMQLVSLSKNCVLQNGLIKFNDSNLKSFNNSTVNFVCRLNALAISTSPNCSLH